jgi:ribosomal protein L10
MEASANDYGDLTTVLKGNSSILIAEIANAPAKIIKDFRKKSDKPLLKGAFINNEIYIGDNLLDSLASLKSKEEVIGEIIGLLQFPVGGLRFPISVTSVFSVAKFHRTDQKAGLTPSLVLPPPRSAGCRPLFSVARCTRPR